MIAIVVHIRVVEDRIEDFIRATQENHAGSRTEPGNLRYDVLRDRDDGAHFILYEAYTTEDAVADHKKTPHYLKWCKTVEPWMAKPRERAYCSVVAPLDEGQW